MWTRLGRAAAVEAGPAVDPTEVEEDEEVEAEASSEAAEEEEVREVLLCQQCCVLFTFRVLVSR